MKRGDVSNVELYKLLTSRRYLTVPELQKVDGYKGYGSALKMKRRILEWSADKYKETSNPRYNIAHLVQIPTEIAIEYCEIDLDRLSKLAIRDQKVLGGL